MDLNGKKHFVVLKMASWLILAYTQTCVPAFSTSAAAWVPTWAQALEPTVTLALILPTLPPSSCRISPGIV